MRTGWVKDPRVPEAHYHSSGAQATGWVRSGVCWYYLQIPPAVAMVMRWVQVGSPGTLADSSAMATG